MLPHPAGNGSKSMEMNSVTAEALHETSLNQYSYLATATVGLAGAMFLAMTQLVGTLIYRLLGAGPESLFLEALVGGASVFAVYAATSEITIQYSWFNTLAGTIIMCLPKKYWLRAYVSPHYFKNYTPMHGSWRFGVPVFKGAIELSYQCVGTIIAVAVLLGIYFAYPVSTHFLGQPRPIPGTTSGSAILAEIVGSTIFYWCVFVAYGANKKRINGSFERAGIAAAGYTIARILTGYTIQSNFNFWMVVIPGIWAGFSPLWWTNFVGEPCGIVLALFLVYIFHREGKDEMSESSYKKVANE
jgi:hypothetical protein